MSIPFEKFKEIARRSFRPVYLAPGDSLQLTYTSDNDGKTVLCGAQISAEQAMIIDEGVIFETTYEGRRALGGFALEQRSISKNQE